MLSVINVIFQNDGRPTQYTHSYLADKVYVPAFAGKLSDYKCLVL